MDFKTALAIELKRITNRNPAKQRTRARLAAFNRQVDSNAGQLINRHGATDGVIRDATAFALKPHRAMRGSMVNSYLSRYDKDWGHTDYADVGSIPRAAYPRNKAGKRRRFGTRMPE